jgi:hypothetical protein
MGTTRRILLTIVLGMLAAPRAGAAQSWRTLTVSRQVEGEKSLDVHIKYGAGTLVVRPADEGLLYRMHLRYDEDLFKPQADFDGHRLRLGVNQVGHGAHFSDRNSGGEMQVGLARGVPMNIDLEFGAVRADLDLGGLSLTGFSLSTGASKSTLDISELNQASMSTATFEVGAADFTVKHLGNLNAKHIDVSTGVGSVTLGFDGAWPQDASVSLSMGLGSMELRFPQGLGVRLHKDSFLTSLDSQDLVKRGDSYYSLNWDQATRKIDIELDAAFGSVRVVWTH